jgi:integration host factor subunit beta
MEMKMKKKTMSKEKLIALISQEKEIHPNDVRHVIQAFLDKATEYLAEGYRLEFRDFGIFEVVERKEKIGRNPKKPEEKIIIPPRRVAKWTPGKKMREQIKDVDVL